MSETKLYYYMGRRAFVEVYKAGKVIERQMTTYDFGAWLKKNDLGNISFKCKRDMNWSEFCNNETINVQSATRKNSKHIIMDFAPPGFIGEYSLSQENPLRVDTGYKFKTYGPYQLDHDQKINFVLATDENDDSFIGLAAFETLIKHETGMSLKEYFKYLRATSPYFTAFKCRTINGVNAGSFTSLKALVPLFQDGGHGYCRIKNIKLKRFPILSTLLKELNKVERVTKVRATKTTTPTFKLIFNPSNCNEFKLQIINSDNEVIRCCSGNIDFEKRNTFVDGVFLHKFTGAMYEVYGSSINHTLYRKFRPMVSFMGMFENRMFITFSPYKDEKQGTPIRMYANKEGHAFVQLEDLLRVTRSTEIAELGKLTLQNDLSNRLFITRFYDRHLKLVEHNPDDHINISEIVLPLFDAMPVLDYLKFMHEQNGYKKQNELLAEKIIKEAFYITQDDYDQITA